VVSKCPFVVTLAPAMKNGFCLVLLTLALANTCSPAAETAAATATATSPIVTPTPGPTPIPLPEIVTEAVSAHRVLAAMRSSLAPSQTKTVVLRSLPDIEHQIDTRAIESTTIINGAPTFGALDELLETWEILAAENNRWSLHLTQQLTELETDATRLDQMATTWNLTSTAPKTKDVPPEVLDRITETIAAIREIQGALQTRRSEILSLQSRVASQHGRIQAELNTVQHARQGLLNRLFERDSPPLWAFNEIASGQSHQHALLDEVQRVKEYVVQEPAKFVIHAVLILCLFVALRWARRGIRRWVEEDPSLQRTVPLFEMPIAVSIALSTLFAPFIYLEAPRLLRAIVALAGLIPTVVLLRRLIDRRLYLFLNALVALFVLDLTRLILFGFPLINRGLFTLEMLIGISFVIWRLRLWRAAATGEAEQPAMPPWVKPGKHRSRLAAWALRISLILLIAALVGNCVGNVSLSYLLGTGVLAGAYLGLIGYAAVRMLEGLVVIALGVRPLTYFAAVRKHRGLLHRRIMRVIECVIFLLWLFLVLRKFQLTGPLLAAANDALGGTLIFGSFRLTLGQIVACALVIWGSFIVSRFLRFLLEEDVYERLKLARGLPYAISAVLHYSILLLGFFFALAALGVDMTKFTILAGAFSVGVGFGLQNVINNFVSGLILLFERPIKVGDVVQVGDAAGSVEKIGIRASVIRTQDGSEVIIPNGQLISNQVTNWTFSDRQRAIVIQISVPRNADQNRVAELLRQAASETPGVAATPPPQAFVVTMTSTTLSFEVRTWTDRFEDWMTVRGDLWTTINRKLAEDNVALA
jgi:potassium-dependent mechanosensitive channel